MTTRHHIDRHAAAVIADGAGGDDDLLSTKEMAAWFRLSPAWFEIGRSNGYGPPFVKLAAQVVRYRRSAVKKWLLERQRACTSEY